MPAAFLFVYQKSLSLINADPKSFLINTLIYLKIILILIALSLTIHHINMLVKFSHLNIILSFSEIFNYCTDCRAYCDNYEPYYKHR